MKFLQCPHCSNQAVKLWEFFVFPSPFWLRKLCRSCNKELSFDFSTIRFITYSLVLGLVIGNVIDRMIPTDSIIFDAVFLATFACIPIFLGKKLFLRR